MPAARPVADRPTADRLPLVGVAGRWRPSAAAPSAVPVAPVVGMPLTSSEEWLISLMASWDADDDDASDIDDLPDDSTGALSG